VSAQKSSVNLTILSHEKCKLDTSSTNSLTTF